MSRHYHTPKVLSTHLVPVHLLTREREGTPKTFKRLLAHLVVCIIERSLQSTFLGFY